MSRPAKLAVILLVGLCLRVAFVWVFYGHPKNILDVDSHVALATSLYERHEFAEVPGVPSIEAPPGYPLWIAFLFALFGKRLFTIFFFNAALGAATGALIYRLGRRFFSPRVGLLAAAIWAVYPYSIYYCGWSYPETFTTFCLTLELLCLLEWYREPTPARACLCGAAAGLVALANPASLMFSGLIPLGLLLKADWHKAAKLAGVYYVLLVVIYSPWPIRNLRSFGSPILTNIHGGMNLYQALIVPPEELGTPRENEAYVADPFYQKTLRMLEERDYLRAYRMYMRGSLRLILENPGRYLWRAGHRALKLWRLVPYRRSYAFDYAKVFWASLLSDGLVIPMALLGFFCWRGRWRELLPCYAAVALWTLAYALVYAVMRFRMPVMPVMVLFAAAGLERLQSRKR